MYVLVEENGNCSPEERMFSDSGPKKGVHQVQCETPEGQLIWCDVIGVIGKGTFVPAQAVVVDDSGAGTAWLVFGGQWGIRFRSSGSAKEWSLSEKTQWGAPFKVLDSSGEDIRFIENDK